MHSISSTIQLAKKAQYALRSNAGLDQAERQSEFLLFQKRVKKTILTQIETALGKETLVSDLVFLLNKAEADQNLLSFLSKEWISFGEMFRRLFGEETLFEFYIWAGTEGGNNAMERMGIEVNFVLRNDAVTEYLKNRENLLIQSVDNTTKDQLVRVIQEGREGLLTEFELKQLIRDRFNDITPARAEAIARTELAEAFNAVEYETYVRNGVEKMRWVTVMDERVCEICAPLHNVEVPVGSNFPGIGRDRPPAHVMCRCFTEEVISGVSVRSNIVMWNGE